MESILEDLRFALRSLRRAPLFTIASLAILALGTGVAGGMFGIVHHLLVLPYDVPGRDRLVIVGDVVPQRSERRSGISPARFMAYRNAAGLERLEAYASDRAVLTTRDGSQSPDAVRITPELFRALGVAMCAGRGFTAADASPGAPATALVSERFARSHVGMNAAGTDAAGTDARGASVAFAVGRTLRLDGIETTIVGVVPTTLELPAGTDLWRPWTPTAVELVDREHRTLVAVGRLRPGTSLAAAQTELAAIGRAESQQFPDTDRDLEPHVVGLSAGVLDDISPMFEKISLVAMVLTLLVVAANLAGLQLARGAARRREWAVRSALGATPARLARQSMVESLLLSAAGGLAGLWVAQLTVRAVIAAMPATITRFIPGWSGIGVDGVLVAYSLLISVGTGIAFGLVPALHAGRVPSADALRGGSSALGSVHARSRAALVVAEVALSLTLLVGGALMLEGFRRMSGPDLGFEPAGVLTGRIVLRTERYPDASSRAVFHARVLECLSALPGVTSVAMMSRLPSSGSTSTIPVTAEGHEGAPGTSPQASVRVVTPSALQLLRVPIVTGREVGPQDAPGAPRVVVINETFARRTWPGREAIGRRLTFADAQDVQHEHAVIGVARDVKRNWFEHDTAPMIYVADAQWGGVGMNLLVRGGRDPLALATPVRQALAALDPDLPVEQLMSVESFLGERTSGVRVGAAIMSWLGVFALLLAAIGLYALVAFHVTRRGPEFGMRMALGAQREDILRLVFGEGVRLVGLGFALGVPLAAISCWAMTAFLFGVVQPTVPTLAGIVLLLSLAAGVALAIPAWRASRLDPVDALRRE